ncbi:MULTISPECIES: hypothetical protein [Paracoccus]|uniref:Uncharacterized protein n=1 Tax=Paracoccus versutus TaxID=34007 RepID=A0A3D9XSN7_PARVE|nr:MULTISPECIES: hypothetical protein [Paracoccus]REF73464.1 hypothetical protein BDD41_2024 [Paracoccus versutus]WGR54745.1 hypothetical protein E3U25_01235 [Paracoccus versutus]
MRFTFTHSHAFPHGRVTVENDGADPPGCLVEFGDGMTVVGAWQQEGADYLVDIPARRTAKGTEISAQRWRLVRNGKGVWRSVRAGSTASPSAPT